MTLQQLGWSAFFQDAFRPYQELGLIPGRVGVQHRGHVLLYTEVGELRAQPSGRLLHTVTEESGLPVTGDWVAAQPHSDERATVKAVLPRRTSFSRSVASNRTEEQVLAANVDTVFIVAALGGEVNLRSVERYLVTAWESGAEPVVILTKADLSLVPYLVTGRTIALLGPSGAGKSTLMNQLAHMQHARTGDVRDDGRGRHTTTRRELVLIPDGGLILDTPGLRELQLWNAGDGLKETFSDIESLSGACRFRDCTHEHEPGCAVRSAVEQGALAPGRLVSWRKLGREKHVLDMKQSVRLQLEEKKHRKDRAIGKRRAGSRRGGAGVGH